MIRVIRFMSANEALRLVCGRQLHNETDHRAAGNATDSIGFCFAIADDSLHDEQSIYNAAKYLSGVTTMDVCLMGRITTPRKERNFIKSTARYSAGVLNELCAEDYDSDSFDDWKLYTPELPRGIFKLVASDHWKNPIKSLTKAGLER